MRIIKEYLIVKTEPELRHIIAHLIFAIECLIDKCPMGAMDNIKSIEGLIMFDGDNPKDWEKYYKNVLKKKEVMKRGVSRKKETKKVQRKKQVQRKKVKGK